MAFKKLTAGLMASSLILGLASTALADITTATPFETASKMNKLGVVMGVGTNPDGSIDFNLGGNLTRAELVTTIVRSFGGEQSAQLAKGAPSFPDVAADAWFSGYVAVAKNIASQRGVTIGRDATHFDPNANVSKAEALVFIMKFLGIKVESSGANWYQAWVAKAVELGIIAKGDADIALASPGASATRGEAFVILDFGYSAKVLEGGASLYTAYVDTVKPTVTASAPETTTDAKVTVSGKASDDKGLAAVFVNGKAVVVKDGNFSAEVADLKVGANSIEVSAQDIAGNTITQTLKVTRTNAAATSIEATDISVAAGADVAVSAKLLDANKAEIADAKFTGTSDLGTFADGKFTAGKTAGTGKLTLKVGDITKDVAVTVVAGDLAAVTADKASAGIGSKVTLTAVDAFGNAISSATFAQTSSDAFLSGNAFVATKAGSYKVTATAGGKTADYTVSVYSTTVAKYTVTSSATSVVANNASEFTVDFVAVDANGNAVLASGLNTVLTLTATDFEVKQADGTFAAQTSVTLANGKKTLTFRTTNVAVGGVTGAISVADGAATALVGKGTIELVDQVATGITVKAPAQFVQNNAPTTAAFTVKVIDQAGKPMISGAYLVNVSVAGAGSTLADDATGANPAATKNLYYFGSTGSVTAYALSAYLQAGDITVTAASTGLTSGSAKITAATAFAAAKLSIAQDVTSATANDQTPVEFDLTTTDSNGVPVSSTRSVTATFDLTTAEIAGGVTVQYQSDGSTWVTVDSTKKTSFNLVAGAATFLVRSYDKTGPVKVTFSDTVGGAGALAGDSKTIAFNADVPMTVGLTRTTAINVPVSTPEVTLTAQMYDDAGNEAHVAGTAITFASDNTSVVLNGGSNSVTVLTDANGVATVKATLPAYVGESDLITVTGAAGSGIGGADSVNVSVVNTVATTMTYTLTKLGAPVTTATAGEVITLAVTVKDGGGRNQTAQALTVTVTGGTTVGTVTLAEVLDASSRGTGVYSGTFQPTSTGRVSLSVKNSTAASAITLPVSLNVRAGAFAGAAISRPDYSASGSVLATTKNISKAFQVIPVDAWMNLAPKTDAGNVTVTWTVAGMNTGTTTGEYFEIRSSETGASVSNVTGFTMAPGTTGQSFYVLTNAANAQVTFTFSAATTTSDQVIFQAK